MKKVTIVLPVSRGEFLDRVIDCLDKLDCKNLEVNLLSIIDGDWQFMLKARNKLIRTKFNQKLILHLPEKSKPKNLDIQERRRRITLIHSTAQDEIAGCDYVFCVEDDTLFPANSLQRLTNILETNPSVGFAQGFELGRWGVPYVGAWIANDINKPTQFKSAEPHTTNSIDAGGLYCSLFRAEIYKEHLFDYSNGVGPDINLGVYTRGIGYEGYVDWSVGCTHLTMKMGKEVSIKPTDKSRQVTLTKDGSKWRATY